MIRLAWRQFRTEAALAVGALALVAVVLGVTGPQLAHALDTGSRQLGSTYQLLQNALGALLLVAPALLGVFFGAPLVARELETGTFRLAWTQSVSRARWLLVKYAVVGVTASVLAGGLSLMVAWWANPVNVVEQNRFSPANFGMFGIVPFGYALFAFALGATAGVVVRRTLPAMVATLVGYVGARFAATYGIRPHFQAPARLALPLSKAGGLGFERSPSGGLALTVGPPSIPNAWPLSASVVDTSGHAPTSHAVALACPTVFNPAGRVDVPKGHGGRLPGGGIQECIAHLSARFHVVVTYQPASRYWPFQAYETALFALAALALTGLSVWWVRRRLV